MMKKMQEKVNMPQTKDQLPEKIEITSQIKTMRIFSSFYEVCWKTLFSLFPRRRPKHSPERFFSPENLFVLRFPHS